MELTNLNKENFFNILYERYPLAMQEFCDWIDQYKIDCNWSEIFGDKIKYHHLPIAMQIGIWVEFIFSFDGDKDVSEDITYGLDYKQDDNIWEWFSEWMYSRQIDLEIKSQNS